MSLTNKTVLITGAGGDIGGLAIKYFSEEGCNVVGIDIDLKKAKNNTAQFHALALQADLTSYEDCKRVIKTALEAYGRIDVLICNAGLSMLGEIDVLPPETFEKIISVNIMGVMNLIHAAIPHIEEDGSIVITSSKAAKRGVAAMAHYVSTKLGLFGLAQSLSQELGPRKIRVNCVCPGDLIEGHMWQSRLIKEFSARAGQSKEELLAARQVESPLHRVCYASDICQAMVFLADSEKSGYTTGQNIDCTGGVTVN